MASAQRVLITGATGFLGGAVARELHRRGYPVLATGRDPRKGRALADAGIAFQACDLSAEPHLVRRMVGGCDAVVHAAALSAPWGRRSAFVAANVRATEHVVQACEGSGTRRLVHISSPSVLFDFTEQSALREDARRDTRPANDYIATKRAAERVVAAAAGRGLSAVMLRPKALFGPGDSTLLPRLVRVASRGAFPLFGAGDPLLDLTWIGDAVEAVVAAIHAPPRCRGRIYHVTSGDPQPRSVVLRTILESCGLPVRFRRIPIPAAMALAGLLEGVSRALTRRGWEPPLTRYTVGALAYGQTLDISAARADLSYAPQGNVLAALRLSGEAWRASAAAGDEGA